MAKTVEVECVWRSTHEVEVPDDFEDTGDLHDFPEEALEEMTPNTASLVDWAVS